MTEQIEAISEDSGKCQSTIRKEIYHREQQKESARNIKYALKKLSGGSVTRIEVERENSTIDIITKKRR